MANIGKLIEQELEKAITRAVREGIKPLQKENIELRKAMMRLERKAGLQPSAPSENVILPEDAPNIKMTGRGLKMLRNKLGLSANDFANLVGVSLPSVYKWEATTGDLPLRSKAKIGLAEAKEMTREQAIEKLESMGYNLGRKARAATEENEKEAPKPKRKTKVKAKPKKKVSRKKKSASKK